MSTFYLKSAKILLPALVTMGLAACNGNKEQSEKMNYPETKKVEVSDSFYSFTIQDPFRWLEIDTAAEVENWVKEQNNFTYTYLDQIPYRQKLNERLTEIYNYEKFSAPFKEGDWTYYFKNDGLQNQSVLYRQKEGGESEIFLDPNKLSSDGTVSLSGLSFTKDGSLAAYSISRAGSDWQEIYVKDAATGQDKSDKIPDAKFTGISWRGNKGFYYSKYDDLAGSKLSAKTQNHKVYFHELGTDASSDKLIFGDDNNPRRYVGAEVTEDEHYLIITTANATSGNEFYLKDLTNPKAELKTVVGNFDNDHNLVTSEGDKLYVLTNLNAPNKRLVVMDANNPAPENWKDIIPETENVLNVSDGAGKLFAHYLKDAIALVEQYDFNGKKERTVELPGPGTVIGLGGKKEEKTLYYLFSSYVFPTTIYSYNPETGGSEVYKKPDVKFNPEDYESKQVFYTSKDGTKIPMIITHKKGLEMNGQNPTMLYGYGGFNISLTPAFSTTVLLLIEQGGVYAVPNIRGGGEYGEKWHKAGTLMNKQNVFDDFIAAAQYLIDNKYTSPDYLAISGGSNGGLLVGAVLTQRPDLVKVALPAVGVLDMLRYNKFTAGAGWATDYGTAEDSEEMFRYLYGYSPYHNVKEGKEYPAVMVTTGDHDDRVVPAHSFKFAAAMQAAQAGDAPVLIRIETDAGHGAGKPTGKLIAESADKISFMLWNMGLKNLR